MKLLACLNKEGNAIFDGYGPTGRVRWVQLSDLTKLDCFSFPMFKNDSIVSELEKRQIETKVVPVVNILNYVEMNSEKEN